MGLFFQLAFRSVQNTMHTLKAKMTKLLYFPSPWSPLQTLNTQQTPQPEVDPVVKDVQESLAIYLRKTVEKQDVASNVKVNITIDISMVTNYQKHVAIVQKTNNTSLVCNATVQCVYFGTLY